MRGLGSRTHAAGSAPLLVLWLLACSASHEGNEDLPPTYVDVVVDADMASRASASRLAVQVWDTEGDEVLSLDEAIGEETFPGRIRLIPRGDDAARRYRIEAQLIDGAGTTLGWQRARGGYVEGEAREIALQFTTGCESIECRGHETCVDGACAPACLQLSAESEMPVSAPGLCQVYVDGRDGIDTASDDPVSCLQAETPCATLDYVLDSYVTTGGGTVVNMHGGATYDSVLLQAPHSGSMARPTVLRAWPDTGMPTFDARGTSTHAVSVCCGDEAASHVVLEGLELFRGTTSGLHIQGGSAHHIVLRDSLVRGNGGSSEMHRGGVLIMGTAHENTIEGCTIADNVSGDEVDTHGIHELSGWGNQFLNNVITGSSHDGMHLRGSRDAVVRGNQVESHGGYGIYIRDSDSLIAHNRVCDTGSSSIRLSRAARVRVEHNTLVRGSGGLSVAHDSTNAEVFNNIISHNRGFGLTTSEESIGFSDSHNLFFDNAMGAVGGWMPATGVLFTEEDPELVDIASCDLRLGPESPAAGAAEDGSDLGAHFEAGGE